MSPDPVEHAVAVARLRAWVHGEAAERPTRAELRAWVDHVLADRDELFAAHEKTNRERTALRREQKYDRDNTLAYARQVEDLQTANRKLRAERDALWADVAGVTEVIGERDALQRDVNKLLEELEKAHDRTRARGKEALSALLGELRDDRDPGDGPGISVTTTTTRMFIPHSGGGAG